MLSTKCWPWVLVKMSLVLMLLTNVEYKIDHISKTKNRTKKTQAHPITPVAKTYTRHWEQYKFVISRRFRKHFSACTSPNENSNDISIWKFPLLVINRKFNSRLFSQLPQKIITIPINPRCTQCLPYFSKYREKKSRMKNVSPPSLVTHGILLATWPPNYGSREC